MTARRIEQLAEGVTLHLGDCREILPTLPRVDAVVTDPPYGIDINKSNRLSVSRGHGDDDWDSEPPAPEDIQRLLKISDHQIIWGGNYFSLPPTRCFLIWDKLNAGRDFADIEMAWTNIDAVARRFQMRPMNMDGGKVHPTQKPIDLMTWCVGHIPPPAVTILDPYMGSGSTGVAAVKRGRQFYGVERSPKYFDIACRRISEALKQPDMFIEAPKPAKQEAFL